MPPLALVLKRNLRRSRAHEDQVLDLFHIGYYRVLDLIRHGRSMTGDELRLARVRLGELWGWPRPPFATELAKIMGSPTKGDAGAIIRAAEARRDEPVHWLLAGHVDLLLRGMIPAGGLPPRPKKVWRRRRKQVRLAA